MLCCCMKTHCALFMIAPAQISAELFCTQSQMMSGVLTSCVLKHLPTPDLELDEFSRLVVKAVIALYGEKQMPVR